MSAFLSNVDTANPVWLVALLLAAMPVLLLLIWRRG